MQSTLRFSISSSRSLSYVSPAFLRFKYIYGHARASKAADPAATDGGWNVYAAWFNHDDQEGDCTFGIHKSGSPWQLLTGKISKKRFKPDEFVPMAFVAVEDRLMVFVDGKKLIDVKDGSYSRGTLSLSSWLGRGEYRNIEYQILDVSPTSASASAPPTAPSASVEELRLGAVPFNSTSDLDAVATGVWKPLVDSTTVLSDPAKMSFREGILELEAPLPFIDLKIRDVIIRADVRNVSAQNVGLSVRSSMGSDGPHLYGAWYNGTGAQNGDFFGITKQRNRSKDLVAGHSGHKFTPNQFADVALAAIGDKITLYVEGKKIHSAVDSDFADGAISLGVWKGKGHFRNVRYQNLDSPHSVTGGQKTELNTDPVPAVAPFSADQAARFQKAWASYLKLPAEYTNSIGMKFRLIPPGKFTMGSTAEQIAAAKPNLDTSQDAARPERIESEGPPHVVTLTRPFYLGVTEVTQLQYKTVVGVNPSYYSPSGTGKNTVGNEDRSNAPVENVTWINTGEFCNQLSSHEKLESAYRITPDLITQTGSGGYRLPTEAEWEFACRAGTNTLCSSGDDDESLKTIAWFSGNNTNKKPNPVGELLPNPFGLFDMHGNAWEQVHDAWRPDSYQRLTGAADVDPRVDVGVESRRVVRGGSHWMSSVECRSACRDVVNEGSYWAATGFRVALSVDAVRQLQTAKDAGNDK